MKELTTEIQISSTPQVVWKKMTNLPDWPSWNPTVNKVKGRLALGEKINLTMSNCQGNDGKKYSATITRINEQKGFTYVAVMMNKFLFSVERIIEIKESEEGVIFSQKERYSGVLAGLFWKKMKEDALPMIESMNRALKKELEK